MKNTKEENEIRIKETETLYRLLVGNELTEFVYDGTEVIFAFQKSFQGEVKRYVCSRAIAAKVLSENALWNGGMSTSNRIFLANRDARRLCCAH